MKTLAQLVMVLALVSACSTPKERHQQRQDEARNEYREDLRQSQETFESDEMDARRSEAKDMINDSKSVDVYEDEGRIQVDD